MEVKTFDGKIPPGIKIIHMNAELEKAFLTGLEQNKHKLLRVCSVYAQDHEDKKDLFQEVLVNIWKSMPSFEGKCSLNTWMYRVTLNVCLRSQTKLSKKKKRFINMDSITLSQYGGSTQEIEESPQLIYLRNCIKKMNEADKAIIALYLEELPYREIADVTGLTENHVAVKVKRIKQKLLNCIKEKS